MAVRSGSHGRLKWTMVEMSELLSTGKITYSGGLKWTMVEMSADRRGKRSQYVHV